jgi:hypothetical protein
MWFLSHRQLLLRFVLLDGTGRCGTGPNSHGIYSVNLPD